MGPFTWQPTYHLAVSNTSQPLRPQNARANTIRVERDIINHRSIRITFLALMALGLSVASSGCSADPGNQVSNAILNSGLDDPRYGQAVGESPPRCAGGEHVYDGTEGRWGVSNAAEEGFLQEIFGHSPTELYSHPIYCAPVTPAGLIAAAKRAINAMPELCADAEALPKGWSLASWGELPDEVEDAAVKEWVAATQGGPVGNAVVTGDAQRSPYTRYTVALHTMQVAVDYFCPN